MVSIEDIFTCAVCNGHRIVEVTIAASVRVEVTAIDCRGRMILGETEVMSDDGEFYACADCGQCVNSSALVVLARRNDSVAVAERRAAAESNESANQEG
jgi:transcription elongation factor Elf1